MKHDIENAVERIRDELFNGSNYDAVPEIYCSTCMIHDFALGQTSTGCETIANLLKGYRAAFPDHRYEFHNVVVDGNMACIRWTVTGRSEQHKTDFSLDGMSMCRFGDDGLIKEIWQHYDNLGLMKQLKIPTAEKLDMMAIFQ